MTATATVQEANGAGPSYNPITNARFNTNDVYNPGSSDPLPIPAAGFTFSYWKSICLQFTGTFTQVDNIRHYCDGTIAWTLGTAGEVRRGNRDAGDHGCPVGSYDEATGTPGSQGDDIETHTYYSGQTTKTVALTGDTGPEGATIDSNAYTSADDRCFFIILQVKVDTDATQGTKATEQFTWKYDEI